MPTAKETLRIGFVIAAMPGNYITQDAVDKYGWSSQVEKAPDPVTDADAASRTPARGKPAKPE